ncbi:hypothetical protein [Rhodobacter xanthinilyticus]|nr:hypothetical protein [Rhodobacter xanthinilyticus]
MFRHMSRPAFVALIGALGVTLAAPPALAGSKSQAGCIALGNGQMLCESAPQKHPGKGHDKAHKATPPQLGVTPSGVRAPGLQRGPHLGDDARDWVIIDRSRYDGRLPRLPDHQHYRVIDGTIVRVDDTTMKVLAVVGLMTDLLN